MWPGIAAAMNCPSVSLEAMPWAVNYHLATRAANRWENLWQPLDGAAGDTVGDTIEISNVGVGVVGEGTAIGEGHQQQSPEMVKVRMHTLDSIKQKFTPAANNIIAIIDVEGFEQETLLGARSMVESGQLKFADVEVWVVTSDGRHRQRYEGIEMLLSNGYRLCIGNQELQSASPQIIEAMVMPSCSDPSNPSRAITGMSCLADLNVWHPSSFTGCGLSSGKASESKEKASLSKYERAVQRKRYQRAAQRKGMGQAKAQSEERREHIELQQGGSR